MARLHWRPDLCRRHPRPPRSQRPPHRSRRRKPPAQTLQIDRKRLTTSPQLWHKSTTSRAPASQATSFRNAGRHHLGISGRLRRNLHYRREDGDKSHIRAVYAVNESATDSNEKIRYHRKPENKNED